MTKKLVYTLDFSQIGLRDVARVGGKNASLGQLFNALKPEGVGVIDGFATTADAYRRLLAERDLEYRLRSLLSDLDIEDVDELARRLGADVALDYRETDVVAEVQKLTDGGADVAIEALGTLETFENSLRW